MQSFLNLLSVVGSVFALSLASADPCESQPCLNNSTCFASEGETWSYNCTCSPGFTGQHCQDRIDNCASNPCAHGNCTSHARGYDCACEPGYRGEECDQPAGLQTPAPSWTESTLPWQPSPAITSPQPNATTTTTTTAPSWQPAVPTLAPWQPEPGHRVVNLTWDVKEMNNSLNLICMNRNLNTSFNSQTPSLEIPEKTSLKIALSGDSAALEFWNVSEAEFQRCSLAHGKNVVPLQAADGFVLTEETLSLGKNYFIALVNDSLRGSVTALRLSVLVKPNNCEDQEKDGVVHECSGMGQCITKPNVATFYCECEEGHIGHFCEEFDACHSNQCQNNATCLDIQQGNNERNFTCVCAPGYTGEVCQSQVDHCVSQPCHNAATCMSRATGYSCLCPEGFIGLECGEKVDPCASLPCQNNGTCFPDGTSYSCSCSPAYTGPTCAQLIDFCALSPCAHGICRSVGTSYKCLCIPGYHGLYCEEEYNECLSAPCQNSGTCKDLVNTYECLCPAEYEGQHCDFYKDPCANASCQNGGTCANEGLNATCICAPGFAGETCETDLNECESNPCHHGATCVNQANGYVCHCPHGWVGANCDIHMEWKSGRMAESLNNMPRHSLYIIIGALCVAFVLMLIILIVGICRISRIEYQGASRPAYEEFYNCRSIDSELSHSIASIRHARFGKKVRPAMYDATPVAYEDYSPDDKPLVTLIKTKDL